MTPVTWLMEAIVASHLFQQPEGRNLHVVGVDGHPLALSEPVLGVKQVGIRAQPLEFFDDKLVDAAQTGDARCAIIRRGLEHMR